MDFSKESYDATYTKVADGVYVISETHRPHHKDSMPELNNRGFIFEVETKNDGNQYSANYHQSEYGQVKVFTVAFASESVHPSP